MAEVSNIRIRQGDIRITEAEIGMAWRQVRSYADMAPWFQAERDAALGASRPGRQEGPGAVPGPRGL
jgi:hypothetical protein